MSRFALATAVALVFLVLSTDSPTSRAAPGTLIADVTIGEGSDCCFGGPNDGVGVAFDGRFLYYSAPFNNPLLHRIETDGSGHLDVPVTDQATSFPVYVDALSWDGGRSRIWAGSGSDIYLVDPETGSAEYKFSTGVGCGLDDGIAYDGTDDSIWWSCDGHVVIYHFSASGGLLGSFPVDSGVGSMLPQCPPYSSGIAVGGDILYLGADGCDFYFTYSKDGEKLETFAYPALRSEDLECDPTTFAPTEVMWIRDAYDGHIRAFEVPPGTCGGGGEDPHPRRVVIFVQGITSESKCEDENGNGLPDGFVEKVDWMKSYLQGAEWLSSQVTIADYRYFSYSGQYCPDGVTPLYTETQTCDVGIDEGFFPRLKALIEDVTDDVPGTKVSIVAHSQGGLVASYTVGQMRETNPNWVRERIASVITFDSFPEGLPGIAVPFLDIYYADCPDDAISGVPPSVNDWNSWSLTSTVPETAENAATPIVGDQYQVAFYTLDADTGVPVESSTDIRGERLHEQIPNTNHSTIWDPGTSRTGQLVGCSIISGLKPAGPRADTCGIQAIDPILPGQTRFASAQIPSGAIGADFGVSWLGSTVEVTVVDPDGQRFDRFSLPPRASHSLGLNFENFGFPNPRIGEWTIEMYGANVPAGGEPVTLSVSLALADADADGIPDSEDNCPNAAEDTDGYQDADGCPDPDNDQDGIEDSNDNCPDVANPSQSDVDSDLIGDACDSDFVPTPTPSPTPAVTPTPTPTPTLTPTPTPTPTALPATQTPSATATGDDRVWGDVDCDGTVGTRDNQALLRNVLDQPLLSQTGDCPEIGTPVTVDGNGGVWGDLDCDGTVGTRDNQALLRNVLEQPALSQTPPCPLIGSQVLVTE